MLDNDDVAYAGYLFHPPKEFLEPPTSHLQGHPRNGPLDDRVETISKPVDIFFTDFKTDESALHVRNQMSAKLTVNDAEQGSSGMASEAIEETLNLSSVEDVSYVRVNSREADNDQFDDIPKESPSDNDSDYTDPASCSPNPSYNFVQTDVCPNDDAGESSVNALPTMVISAASSVSEEIPVILAPEAKPEGVCGSDSVVVKVVPRKTAKKMKIEPVNFCNLSSGNIIGKEANFCDVNTNNISYRKRPLKLNSNCLPKFKKKAARKRDYSKGGRRDLSEADAEEPSGLRWLDPKTSTYQPGTTAVTNPNFQPKILISPLKKAPKMSSSSLPTAADEKIQRKSTKMRRRSKQWDPNDFCISNLTSDYSVIGEEVTKWPSPVLNHLTIVNHETEGSSEGEYVNISVKTVEASSSVSFAIPTLVKSCGVTKRRSKANHSRAMTEFSSTSTVSTSTPFASTSSADPRRSLTTSFISLDKEIDIPDDDHLRHAPPPRKEGSHGRKPSDSSSSHKSLTFLPWNEATSTASPSSISPPNASIANLTLKDSPPRAVASASTSLSSAPVPMEATNNVEEQRSVQDSNGIGRANQSVRSPSSPSLTHDHLYASSPLAGIQSGSEFNRNDLDDDFHTSNVEEDLTLAKQQLQQLQQHQTSLLVPVSPEDSEEENQIPNLAPRAKSKKTTKVPGAKNAKMAAAGSSTSNPPAKKKAGRKKQSPKISTSTTTITDTTRVYAAGNRRRVNYSSFFDDDDDDFPDSRLGAVGDDDDAPSDGEAEWKPSKNIRVGERGELDLDSSGAFAHLRERSSRGSTPIISNGLPEEKPKYAKKKKYTVEEIYKNKNYVPPKEKLWETIFEKPELEEGGFVAEKETESMEAEDVIAEEPNDVNSETEIHPKRSSSLRPRPPIPPPPPPSAFGSASLMGTRKKRKSDFVLTKAKIQKRKQKAKKTEGKYKLPTAARREDIEREFRQKLSRLEEPRGTMEIV